MPKLSSANRLCRFVVWSALASGISPVASGSEFQILNPTIVSGAADQLAGDFRLIGTFGEPVAGQVEAGSFRLTAGFPATLPDPDLVDPDDELFTDRFEASPGEAE